MGVAKGGYSGISSTTISCKRCDVAFGEDDAVRESLCCNHRRDIKPILQKLVQKGELSQELFDSVTSNEGTPDSHEVLKCLQNTISVPLEMVLALKKIQEGTDVEYFPCFSHPFDAYGSDPPD